MQLSRTWRRRLARGGGYVRAASRAAVVVAAVIGLAAGFKVFCVSQHPNPADVASIATRVDNQRDAAGQFAADFVAAVLTTPSAHRAALQRFITLSSDAAPPVPAASTTPPAVIGTPKVWSVIPAGSVGGADVYSVTVAVQQRPYASADATRAFYRVAVSVWNYQPRALDMPTPISDPGPGADLKITYGHPLDTNSPVYAVVAGFIRTYLTATTGLDRYVVAGSWLKPIGDYRSATVKTAETDREIGGNLKPGTQIHVRASILAQTSQFATVDFSCPLTVENSGGTWMIADIDLIPHINSETDAQPVGAPHG
ncbi:conjugal transfer protein [uncultured Mycobacterium sp.]|uniref:conjugal transfer protein n=1 Tax=uncultured Mycobacterium sp. TaxID=171292 RepID=UPI0035C9B15D